jgi:hypothetical protein
MTEESIVAPLGEDWLELQVDEEALHKSVLEGIITRSYRKNLSIGASRIAGQGLFTSIEYRSNSGKIHVLRFLASNIFPLVPLSPSVRLQAWKLCSRLLWSIGA